MLRAYREVASIIDDDRLQENEGTVKFGAHAVKRPARGAVVEKSDLIHVALVYGFH